jgi:hypothetical protein
MNAGGTPKDYGLLTVVALRISLTFMLLIWSHNHHTHMILQPKTDFNSNMQMQRAFCTMHSLHSDILYEAFNSFSNSVTQMHLSCVTASRDVGLMSHQP